MMKKVLSVIALAFIASGFLVACSDSQADGPEPTSGQIVDGTNMVVIRMPNGFRNVTFVCHGTNGIYVTSRGGAGNSNTIPSSLAVVPNDPMCH